MSLFIAGQLLTSLLTLLLTFDPAIGQLSDPSGRSHLFSAVRAPCQGVTSLRRGLPVLRCLQREGLQESEGASGGGGAGPEGLRGTEAGGGERWVGQQSGWDGDSFLCLALWTDFSRP